MNIPYKHVNIGGEIFRVPDLGKMFGGWWVIILIVIALWMASGIYIVGPDEEGVIRTFGKMTRIHSPGLHYHFPYPIEQVLKPKVTEVKRIEIGFRSRRGGQPLDVPEESLMLTGGLNIVDMDFIVQYKIQDPVKYLFFVRDVPTTMRIAAEAVIRQVVGKHKIDEVLTTGKGELQAEALQSLQSILNSYEIGVTVTQIQLKDVWPPNEVEDAFREVASAKEDRARLINEAQGYENKLIPKTRGEAAEQVKQAEAYAAERVTRAEGDAANFLAVLEQYRRSPNVTRKRMLLETLEIILPRFNKYILDSKNGDLINVVGSSLAKEPSSVKGGSR
ncbi:FtsH protease activity modulator HflK [bacterium]|nr:FtsH protease activity modulator HflK [bacterium]